VIALDFLVERGSFLFFLSILLAFFTMDSFICAPKKRKKMKMFSSCPQRMIALICCKCSPLVNYLYFYTVPKLKEHLKHAKFKS
jgi:hypothetical protein